MLKVNEMSLSELITISTACVQLRYRSPINHVFSGNKLAWMGEGRLIHISQVVLPAGLCDVV